jgi:hypothetical protein
VKANRPLSTFVYFSPNVGRFIPSGKVFGFNPFVQFCSMSKEGSGFGGEVSTWVEPHARECLRLWEQ